MTNLKTTNNMEKPESVLYENHLLTPWTILLATFTTCRSGWHRNKWLGGQRNG